MNDLDPEVLKVAQAAADVKRERDVLRLEVQNLQHALSVANSRLEEKQQQIDRVESRLLLAVMRHGQQVSIIEQIAKLTEAWHESVQAETAAPVTPNELTRQ